MRPCRALSYHDSQLGAVIGVRPVMKPRARSGCAFSLTLSAADTSETLPLRPRWLDKKTRLKMLRRLSLCNTEVTDVSMRYITLHLPQLTTLSVSGCWKLTDAGHSQNGHWQIFLMITIIYRDQDWPSSGPPSLAQLRP